MSFHIFPRQALTQDPLNIWVQTAFMTLVRRKLTGIELVTGSVWCCAEGGGNLSPLMHVAGAGLKMLKSGKQKG